MGAPHLRYDPDAPVRLSRLVYFVDGDEVTIGCRDTDSYAIFPPDGAEVVRRLEDGQSPRQVARWYEAEYGETPDMEHILNALAELELIDDREAPASGGDTVRWQRLGRMLFSWPAWVLYTVLIGAALVAILRSPDLAPRYQNIFFTDYYTLLEMGLFVGTIPLLILHESFHALAGRRLGIRSRLRISHRLYYLVLETSLDGLVTVPRRQRWLPILAGMLADVLVFSILTLLAASTREPDGGFSFLGRLCLAVAFIVMLRVIWQFFFYLRTDLYTLITTLLGCVDLHTTATRLLRSWLRRLRHRLTGWFTTAGRSGPPATPAAEPDSHPADRRAAPWYAGLIVVGYTVSIGTFVLAVAPVVYQMFAGALGRFFGTGTTSWDGLLDSVVFVALNVSQVLVTIWLAVRERRQRRQARLHHVTT